MRQHQSSGRWLLVLWRNSVRYSIRRQYLFQSWYSDLKSSFDRVPLVSHSSVFGIFSCWLYFIYLVLVLFQPALLAFVIWFCCPCTCSIIPWECTKRLFHFGFRNVLNRVWYALHVNIILLYAYSVYITTSRHCRAVVNNKRLIEEALVEMSRHFAGSGYHQEAGQRWRCATS